MVRATGRTAATRPRTSRATTGGSLRESAADFAREPSRFRGRSWVRDAAVTNVLAPQHRRTLRIGDVVIPLKRRKSFMSSRTLVIASLLALAVPVLGCASSPPPPPAQPPPPPLAATARSGRRCRATAPATVQVEVVPGRTFCGVLLDARLPSLVERSLRLGLRPLPAPSYAAAAWVPAHWDHRGGQLSLLGRGQLALRGPGAPRWWLLGLHGGLAVEG